MLAEVAGQTVVQVLVELGAVSPLQPRAQTEVGQLHVALETQTAVTPSNGYVRYVRVRRRRGDGGRRRSQRSFLPRYLRETAATEEELHARLPKPSVSGATSWYF